MQSHTDADTNELIITRAERDLAASTLPSTSCTQSRELGHGNNNLDTLKQARDNHVINKCTKLTQGTKYYEMYTQNTERQNYLGLYLYLYRDTTAITAGPLRSRRGHQKCHTQRWTRSTRCNDFNFILVISRPIRYLTEVTL